MFAVLFGPGVALSAPEEGASAIDPKADAVLREMSAYLAGLKALHVEGEDTVDLVLDSGQKIQLSHHRTLVVRRPDRAAAEIMGDDAHKRMCYSGRTLAFLDVAHNVYAVAEVPGTIDGMVRHVREMLGIHLPFGDLLAADPYGVLAERVESGMYAGLHRVGPWKCHHLAFTQEHVDWQVWVDAGGSPIPRKFVITYKKQTGQPQYSVLMTVWDDTVEPADGLFEFTPPEGAAEVEFLEAAPSASMPRIPKSSEGGGEG